MSVKLNFLEKMCMYSLLGAGGGGIYGGIIGAYSGFEETKNRHIFEKVLTVGGYCVGGIFGGIICGGLWQLTVPGGFLYCVSEAIDKKN